MEVLVCRDKGVRGCRGYRLLPCAESRISIGMTYVTTLVDLVLAQICFVCLSNGSIVALRFSRRVSHVLRPLRCYRLPVNVRESHLVYGGKVLL